MTLSKFLCFPLNHDPGIPRNCPPFALSAAPSYAIHAGAVVDGSTTSCSAADWQKFKDEQDTLLGATGGAFPGHPVPTRMPWM